MSRSVPQLDRIRRVTGVSGSVLPVYGVVLILIVVAWLISPNLTTFESARTILTLATFLAILGLGQGVVIMTGGIDMSVPWGMATAGIMLTSLSGGQDETLIWVVPVVLLFGVVLGLVNGLGVALLGVSPLVMTIAVNVIVRGLTLVAINGTPTGLTPPAAATLMTGRIFGIVPPVLLLVAVIYVVAVVVLTRTRYGRWLRAVGTNSIVAGYSGVDTRAVVVSAYVVSGVMSAVAGVFLTGYSTLAFVNMGDPYLLPSIAVVVVGGAAITGGRGSALGTLGGAIVLTLLGTILGALSLPAASRNIAFGLLVLGAVLAASRARDRDR